MVAPAGFAGQAMYKSETTWGTAVTPDKGVEVIGGAVKNQIPRYESQGIRAGRRVNHRWAAGVPLIGGPVHMELPNVNMAPLLKHMFGTIGVAGSGPYVYTASPGSLTGLGMTWQFGLPDAGGTSDPFTWAGCKVADWTISGEPNAYAKLDLNLSAKSELTATALATASYAGALAPFTAVQSSLTIAGSSVAVNSFDLTGNNNLKVDREGPGSSTIREQLENGWREYSGTVQADFEGLTAYNRYVNGTEAALVLSFSNGTDSLVITMNVRFDGETPELSGPEMLSQPLPYKATSGTSDAAAITAVLTTSDASSA